MRFQPRAALRRILVIATMVIAAGTGMACSEEALGVPPLTADSVAVLEEGEAGVDRLFSPLGLTTPDGWHQTVHPDYALMPQWSPRRYIVATPFAFSDIGLENPSLYYQSPDFTWKEFGLNPIAKPRAGYLSDPDMVALPDLGQLWIYYREVTRRNTIWLIRSLDGLHWSPPKRVVSAPRHSVVSPSVVRRAPDQWLMWSVNAGKLGCTGDQTSIELRRSSDGLEWSPPIAVSLAQPPYWIWHIEVQWIPSRQEYWALYNVKTGGNCDTQALYLATSPDGLAWTTYPSPILTAGVIPEFNHIVYRSAFSYNPRTDNIRFWFAGARWLDRGFVWQTVYQRRTREEVFSTINAPKSALILRLRPNIPSLVNPP